MSAMAKMFADMVLKELPDEIRDALTPENMQRVAKAIQDKWTLVETVIIETRGYSLMALGGLQYLEARLERIDLNVRTLGSGDNTGPVKRRASSNARRSLTSGSVDGGSTD